MVTGEVDATGSVRVEVPSSKNKSTFEDTIEHTGDAMDPHVDPDAQTTVTDFLDFTEYLPSDMVRSLTLIGNLDEQYVSASHQVDDLTKLWGQLPSIPAHERPSSVKIRGQISDHLDRAINSRVFAHDEAVRMSDSVERHYGKAKILLSKLQSMLDTYPTEEVKSPVNTRSPQLSRTKGTPKTGGDSARKTRRKRIPKITVPGEVLAPYDIEYDLSDDSDISTDPESEPPAAVRRTPATIPKIKLLTNKTPKTPKARQPPMDSAALSAAAAANAAALLKPPPENAVIGSADAPWLQLTQYELAKLRKRMKKNATWSPSETMIARELKSLCRGPEAYREAKKKAEDEGRPFEPTIPAPVLNAESGTKELPAGAMSVSFNDVPTSNRGMKLNEAKKLKREAMAKLAAEEAAAGEAEKTPGADVAASRLLAASSASPDTPKSVSRSHPRPNNKRKRGAGEAAEENEVAETPSRPQLKRNKTETPVPPPQRPSISITSSAENLPATGLAVNGSAAQIRTPVPLPKQPSRAGTSHSPGSANSSKTVTTSVPTKAPAQTPVPLPASVASLNTSPVNGTTRSTRQTRGETVKQQQHEPEPANITSDLSARRSLSRAVTPLSAADRRPPSRGGKAASQEPQPTAATDRPRRSSTTRSTPVAESKPPSAPTTSSTTKRVKRPAPGIVSTTSSGGNSAVGKRKAAPRKKARTTKKGKDQTLETEMEEVDDEGNPIDPDEPRYCSCNRVSFGTMIQCEEADNCKTEWFHLECVGLDDIPKRTTKWYCPDCRKAKGLGDKGEVNARGVKK